MLLAVQSLGEAHIDFVPKSQLACHSPQRLLAFAQHASQALRKPFHSFLTVPLKTDVLNQEHQVPPEDPASKNSLSVLAIRR